VSTDESSDFGWNFFTAADEESRRNYAALLVAGTLDLSFVGEQPGDTYNNRAETEVRQLLLSRIGINPPVGGHIDHQSASDVFGLPKMKGPYGVDTPAWEFMQQFVNWFAKAPIVVLGGNDNDDHTHPLLRDSENEGPVDFIYGMRGIARKDPKYGFWTLFNRHSGTKLRINFNAENPKDVVAPPTRASLPELVDLKITDYCPFNCSFCYMGSTTKGNHADFDFVKKIIERLKEAQVFEVAIGGGEPTLHPQFPEICQAISLAGMNCNFTTKSLTWLRDPVQAATIVASCTAFAYSVERASDVTALYDAMVPWRRRITPSVQVVVGAVRSYDLAYILQEAKRLDIWVTLLGFKTTGRGAAYPKEEYDWVEIVQKAGYANIAIDTVLAKEIDGKNVAFKGSYHTQEGAWSFYIDATTQQAGPSSYCYEAQKVPILEFDRFDTGRSYPKCKNLVDIFNSLQPE
jgi:hypothetical protein